MGFESLLGNEQLKKNLAESINKKHISHFYLISGPQGSGKHTLAKLLAAAILCQKEEKPCLRCAPCRKLMEGNHPDFITVEDPEHKNVAVKVVRQFREDVFILPNESDYKIYLIAQELGTEGQNALLKILEEPPKYGVFLLLTENPDKLLPTVRSRCTQLKLQSLPEAVLRRELQKRFPQSQQPDIDAAVARSGGYLGQAISLLETGTEASAQTEGFARAFASRSSLELVQTLAPMEKWKRDALTQELQSWLTLLEDALVCRSGIQIPSPAARNLAANRSSRELHHGMVCLKKALDYTMRNVSPAAVCGYLAWVLREE